ncbi:Superoxide dismutase [Mn] 1 [bioreactor metagenome]|uniref:superoxide dismutase n=1 Tax=bioreactor metagenome TaxID=1076179 RepID=A0A645DVB9_9ZZZZ
MEHYPFINPPLPYAYSALEPYIDTKTMHIHHDRHLQAYTDNLNKALADKPALQGLTLEQLIMTANRMPPDTGVPISRNAGGVYNHRFYFNGMSPSSTGVPFGELAWAIDESFGSFESFKEKFTAAAMSVFGSGYAWLVCDQGGRLKIITTANQETPLPLRLCPILNIDVWEHAYYLKHYNERAKYIDDWWNVVNWGLANARYADRTDGQNC